MLQTEFPFTLPIGYVDEEGSLHQAAALLVEINTSRSVPCLPRRRRRSSYRRRSW